MQMHWRRAVWLGKSLKVVRTILQWNFQHRGPGDVFHSVTTEILISFHQLTTHSCNMSEWSEFCVSRKPLGWVRYDNGRTNLRRSPRLLICPSESQTRNLSKDRSYSGNSLAGSLRVDPRLLMCHRMNYMFIPTQRMLSMDCGKLVVVFGPVMDQTTTSVHTFQSNRPSTSTERNSRQFA